MCLNIKRKSGHVVRVQQYRACVVNLLVLGIRCGVQYCTMCTSYSDIVCFLFKKEVNKSGIWECCCDFLIFYVSPSTVVLGI